MADDEDFAEDGGEAIAEDGGEAIAIAEDGGAEDIALQQKKATEGLLVPIMLTEFRRQRVIWAGAFAHVVLLIAAGFMIAISLSLGETYVTYFKMIGLDINLTVRLLTVSGGASVVLGFGGFFMLVFGLYYDKRKMLKHPMLGYTLAALALFVVNMGLTIMAYVSYGSSTKEVGGVIGKTYLKPFQESMKAYKDKIETKATIDDMQQLFECCGNDGYTDWFKVQWYPFEFLDRASSAVSEHTQNNEILFEDVPFSCCNPAVKRPCIHHKVYDNDIHFNYDHNRDLTLFKVGCRKEMLKQYDTSLRSGVFPTVICTAVIYLLIVLIVRYLHTSFDGAILKGDPEAPAFGYLIQYKDSGAAAGTAGNNANNANRSRNNSFLTRIRRRFCAMRGQRSPGSSSCSASYSSSTSTSCRYAPLRSSATDRASQTGVTLRLNQRRARSDDARSSDAAASWWGSRRSAVSDNDAVRAGKKAVTEIMATVPRGQPSNPKLLYVVRAIARLKASRQLSRTNYSGNCGDTDAEGLEWDITSPSLSPTSSRSTTVRFAGSETTTFISDPKSSTDNGQYVHGIVFDLGAGTTSTASKTGTTRTASKTDTTRTASKTGTIRTTSNTGTTRTASKTGTIRTTSNTDTSSPRTDITSISFVTDTTSLRTGATNADSMTDITSQRTGAISAGSMTGATSSRTGATSSRTDATSSRTGANSSRTGAISSGTGATSSRTGATSSRTGATSSRTGATRSGPDATSSGTGATSSKTGATRSGPDATSSGTGATRSGTDATSSGTGATSSGTTDATSARSMTDTTSPRTGATSVGSMTDATSFRTGATSTGSMIDTDTTSSSPHTTISWTDATSTRSRTGATSTGSGTRPETGTTSPISSKASTTTGYTSDATNGSRIKTGSTTTPTPTPTGYETATTSGSGIKTGFTTTPTPTPTSYKTDTTSGSGIKTGSTTTPTGSIIGITSRTSTKTDTTPTAYKTDTTSGSGINTGYTPSPTPTVSKTDATSGSNMKTGSTTTSSLIPTGYKTDTTSGSGIKTGSTTTPAGSITDITSRTSTRTGATPTAYKTYITSGSGSNTGSTPTPTPTGSKTDITSSSGIKIGSITTGYKTDTTSGSDIKMSSSTAFTPIPTLTSSKTDITSKSGIKTGTTQKSVIPQTGTTSLISTKTSAISYPSLTSSKSGTASGTSSITSATPTQSLTLTDLKANIASETRTKTVVPTAPNLPPTGSKTSSTRGTSTKSGVNPNHTVKPSTNPIPCGPEADAITSTSTKTGVTTCNKANTTSTGSDTGTSSSTAGSSSTDSETGISSIVSSTFGSRFSGLSTRAVTTGSHLAEKIDHLKGASMHSSASSYSSSRKGSHDHRRRSRHHRRRSSDSTRDRRSRHRRRRSSDSTRDPPVDSPTSPSPSILQSDPRISSSHRGASDRRLKKTSKLRVPGDVAPLSAATTRSEPSSVTSGHGRRSTKQQVRDDVLVNGEELRAVEEITEDYHAYEEIPQHVYEEIREIPVYKETLVGGRLHSDLSTQLIQAKEGIPEEQPFEDPMYSMSPSSNEQGEQPIYEEIPYGDHVNRYRPLPNVPEGEHIYQEIPYGRHLYRNRSLPNGLIEEPIYEEIPYGYQTYNNMVVPNILEEEHVYEEIPFEHDLYINRTSRNVLEEEHIYDEIPLGHRLYNNRALPNIPEEEHTYEDAAGVKPAQEISPVRADDAKKIRPVENFPDEKYPNEEIPLGGHVYSNVTTQSAQDQSGYPDRWQSRAAEHVRTQPNLRKYKSAKELRDHAQWKSSDQRCVLSNPELGNFSDYSRRQADQVESAYTELQELGPEHSYTAAVSRGNGPNMVLPGMIYQTVPNRQAHHERTQDDAPENAQREPSYTGLQDHRSADEHTYAVVGSRPSQADNLPQTLAITQIYHERFGSDNGRPQNFSSESVFAEQHARRPEQGNAADVSSSSSRSEVFSSNTAPQSNFGKQTCDGPAGRSYGRRHATQGQYAYTGQQDRRSTAVGELPSQTDTLPPRNEPAYQGRGETSHGASSHVGSRTRENESTRSETNKTGQAPNQHFYMNAVPQAPPISDAVVEPAHSLARSISKHRRRDDVSPKNSQSQTQHPHIRREHSDQAPPPSADVVEPAHSLVRSISKHRRRDDISPQNAQSQTQYQQRRRELSDQSTQNQPANQVPLQAVRSPHHSSTSLVSQAISVVTGNLISNQPPHLKQIRSEDNGQLVHSQSAFQSPMGRVGKSSQHSATSIAGVLVNVASNQSRPQLTNSQQALIPEGSQHPNRPPVPPKSTTVKEIAKQILLSDRADPISNQQRHQQTNPQRLISEQPVHRYRPLVPPKPPAVQQIAKEITSTVATNQVFDLPQQHRSSEHHQVRPEHQANTLSRAKQADRSEPKHKIDFPFDSQKSGRTKLHHPSSQGVGTGDGVNKGQHPIVPPKPTKTHTQYDKHSSIKTKLEGIYSRTSISEPASNYKIALNLARSAENSAVAVNEPSQQESIQLVSKSSHGSSRPSRTSQSASHPPPPLPPPPPPLPPSLGLPIKGILVRRHHSGSALSNPSSSAASVTSESTSSSSGMIDEPMTDSDRLLTDRALQANA